MVRQIRGKVLDISASGAVIEIVGVGIEVRVSAPEALAIGSDICLATRLVIKQDGVELYGFTDAADRDFFERMLSVSGVGPRTALAILRRAPREALVGAIAARDLPYLTKVVGLGTKSAEKLLVELADKVGTNAHDGADGEIFDTLVALGYTEREARRTLQAIPANVAGKDARLKAALASGRS